jgi:hypothetical protein
MSGKPLIEADVRLRHEASQSRLAATTYAGGDKKPSGILFPNQDLFLAQKIEVGRTAGTRIDDGGQVAGKIVRITLIRQRKNKRNL